MLFQVGFGDLLGVLTEKKGGEKCSVRILTRKKRSRATKKNHDITGGG